MGTCFSSPSVPPEQAARHAAIEKQLRSDAKEAARTIKLLLLGAGDSGKSTTLKSMRIIHNQPFSEDEMEAYRNLIYENVVRGLEAVLEAMRDFQIPFADPSKEALLPQLHAAPELSGREPFPLSLLPVLQALYADPAVQTTYATQGDRAAFFENLPHYYADLPRLFERGYRPSERDVLHARAKTTGISETDFDMGGQVVRICDVGGQRSERRKWINCFSDVTAILFLISLPGYDLCLHEDTDSNQMQEALLVYDSIASSSYFTSTSIILFLNKYDLFRKKVLVSPIGKHFPQYEGGPDAQAGATFFRKRFMTLNRSKEQHVYPHQTTATDPALVKKVWISVRDTILSNHLRELKLV